MIEQSIWTLQFIQIKHHFPGCTVQVFDFARCFKSSGLHDGDHVHIVDPEARLPGVSFLRPGLCFLTGILWKFPLCISIGQAQV
ncbi:hypothetical protein D3C81_1898540 [compost metagenome]